GRRGADGEVVGGRRGDRQRDREVHRGVGGAGGGDGDGAVVRPRRQARGARRQGDRRGRGAGGRAQGQPGLVAGPGPGERAAAGVADVQRLVGRVGAARGAGEGEAGRAGADGRRHGALGAVVDHQREVLVGGVRVARHAVTGDVGALDGDREAAGGARR